MDIRLNDATDSKTAIFRFYPSQSGSAMKVESLGNIGYHYTADGRFNLTQNNTVRVEYDAGTYTISINGNVVLTFTDARLTPHHIIIDQHVNTGFLTSFVVSDLSLIVTPTPTPIVTPTPTPLPKTKKVVVVPGIEATWNADALLNCKMDGYSGDWTLGPYAYRFYQPLYDILNKAGWEVEPFYYDWRQPITYNAAKLKKFIDEKADGGNKVNLVGHSMGGLIGRAYVGGEENNNRLDKMLTAGTPHRGVVVAYPAWSAGELWKKNPVEKIALTLLLKRCDAWPTRDKTAIRQYIPSIRDLLPIFDYLKDKKTGLFKDAMAMESKNDWLLGSNFASPFWGVKVGTLAGRGQSTLTSLGVRDRNLVDKLLGNWADGKPVGKNWVKEGDGTVLVENAQLPGADNRLIAENHVNLAASTEAMKEILAFLGTPMTVAGGLIEPTSALVVAGTGATFEIADPTGKMTKDKDGIITIYDPKPGGKYKLSIRDASEKAWVGVAKFKSDGSVEWREYLGKRSRRIGEEVVWK
ncbi:alpha/beta fold hydrolase [Candidatus Amesbacteria bacterium]|nr:alpha/beta fold hydrolase [Candidatus Amesbacteria bacterium]